MIRIKLLFAAGIILLAACKNPATQDKSTDKTGAVVLGKDVHTLSNADAVLMKHLELDIKVDMDAKKICGRATWDIENEGKVDVLNLDTYDLSIDSVMVDGKPVQHTLDSTKAIFGGALHIPITAETKSVSIWYCSGKNATALQWLDPQQTHDKKHPFLYTQSESIYARSWIPCADGPGIRFTYDARVSVPKGLLALMSAQNPQQVNDSGVYHFKMEIPVPAYLMALSVGDIAFRKIDERTGVYAEPGMITKARYEFEEVGKMVTNAEKLYGPYRWGRYDAIVLPPGFPIGGMENPRLTFCTPTIIAGDRSLMNLVAHELAHSWSGNLVTNATWSDFWLNEGFTVYFERRISEAMMGKDYVDMLWELGYQDLVKEVNELGKNNPDTRLKLDLAGRDPDDGLTDIAYEKGALLLRLIELNAGREKFDAFLKKYFDEHAFKTIYTEQFISYLNENLIKGDSALAKKINVKEWVYGTGIPDNCPRVDPARFKVVDAERAKFLKGVSPQELQTENWSTNEWLQFLRNMPKPLSLAQMTMLDDAFNFTHSGNSEIADLWYVMSVSAKYLKAYKAMQDFLSRVGRRKFLEPIYTELMKDPDSRALAKRLFGEYRMNYHPLAQGSLEKIVYKK